jgi:hypothetical protein
MNKIQKLAIKYGMTEKQIQKAINKTYDYHLSKLELEMYFRRVYDFNEEMRQEMKINNEISLCN